MSVELKYKPNAISYPRGSSAHSIEQDGQLLDESSRIVHPIQLQSTTIGVSVSSRKRRVGGASGGEKLQTYLPLSHWNGNARYSHSCKTFIYSRSERYTKPLTFLNSTHRHSHVESMSIGYGFKGVSLRLKLLLSLEMCGRINRTYN